MASGEEVAHIHMVTLKRMLKAERIQNQHGIMEVKLRYKVAVLDHPRRKSYLHVSHNKSQLFVKHCIRALLSCLMADHSALQLTI